MHFLLFNFLLRQHRTKGIACIGNTGRLYTCFCCVAIGFLAFFHRIFNIAPRCIYRRIKGCLRGGRVIQYLQKCSEPAVPSHSCALDSTGGKNHGMVHLGGHRSGRIAFLFCSGPEQRAIYLPFLRPCVFAQSFGGAAGAAQHRQQADHLPPVRL